MTGKRQRNQTTQRRQIIVAASVLLTGLVAGCPPPPQLPPDETAVSIVPDTGTGSVVSYSDGVIRLAAGAEPPTIGEVLVSTQGAGFLRRVESVSTEPDGSVTVRTSQATLAEVVENGDFAFTDGPPTAKSMARAQSASFQVFSLQKSFSTNIYSQSGMSVDLAGGFGLDASLELAMSFRNSRLTYFAVSADGEASLDISAAATMARGATFGTTGDGRALLQTPIQTYLYGSIGGIPVVIVVSANLYAGVEGQVDGVSNLTTGASTSSHLRFGASWSDGEFGLIRDQGFVFTPEAPTWCLQGELGAKIFIKPVIELQIYGVAGPRFDLEPYVEFTGEGRTCLRAGQEPSGEYSWELAAGLAGHAKLKFDVLDLLVLESPTLTLFDLRWPLLSGRSGPGGHQDSDGDGVPDTEDDCPDDPNKTSPGDCGCGVPETFGCGEQPGLVARWICDGNARDASGNGNHGTASGAVLAADRFGNPNAAYQFDGVDDGVQVPNSSSLNISGNRSISITAWIRAASIPPVRGGIVWKWGPGGPEDDQYTLHLRDGGYPSFVLSDVWTTMVQAPAPVTLHAWTHVAGVYDSAAGQMRLYVNGTLADSRSLSYYNIRSTAEPVYIGRGCNLDDFFHGTIDDVRIYNRALSAGEVATLAQGQ